MIRTDQASRPKTRIGVIVPQSNTTNEVEFNRLIHAKVSFHFSRIPLHLGHIGKDPETHLSMLTKDLEVAAKHLESCDCEIIVFGCTADSMAFGDDLLVPIISEAANAPAITTATAITSTLSDLNIQRIALATPYTEETNTKEAAFLERAGFSVVAKAGLSLNTSMQNIKKMSRVSPNEVCDLVLSVDTPEADAILICCTDFNSLDVVEPLEEKLGKPIITSNTATYATVMKRLGLKSEILGYGQLLAS